MDSCGKLVEIASILVEVLEANRSKQYPQQAGYDYDNGPSSLSAQAGVLLFKQLEIVLGVVSFDSFRLVRLPDRLIRSATIQWPVV